jgi:flavin reductase (DIM6/NTAB) family NADH-FMN oxidoreductase RutF
VNDLRAVMRRFPTGVTVVTTILDGKPKGFTATAFSSVSLEPPMVLICVNRNARTHPMISQAGIFCVNLLPVEHRGLAERFARRDDADPFAEVAYERATTGAPVLAGSLGFVDCTVAEEYSAGTHTVFIGAVLATGHAGGVPLGYLDGTYRDFGIRVP